MTTIALPRIKTKRRRRRPPNHRERIAIASCSLQGLFILLDVMILLAFWPRGFFQLIAISFSCFFFWIYWPIVLAYIRDGYEDD